MMLTMTNHARTRIQQRGIPEAVVETCSILAEEPMITAEAVLSMKVPRYQAASRQGLDEQFGSVECAQNCLTNWLESSPKDSVELSNKFVLNFTNAKAEVLLLPEKLSKPRPIIQMYRRVESMSVEPAGDVWRAVGDLLNVEAVPKVVGFR
jgi:hypothetical protein